MNSTGASAWMVLAGGTEGDCVIALAAAINPAMNARLCMSGLYCGEKPALGIQRLAFLKFHLEGRNGRKEHQNLTADKSSKWQIAIGG
jgi:hypothetical protein